MNEFAFLDLKSCYIVKSNAVGLFFWRIYGLTVCFQNYLTFNSSQDSRVHEIQLDSSWISWTRESCELHRALGPLGALENLWPRWPLGQGIFTGWVPKWARLFFTHFNDLFKVTISVALIFRHTVVRDLSAQPRSRPRSSGLKYCPRVHYDIIYLYLGIYILCSVITLSLKHKLSLIFCILYELQTHSYMISLIHFE